MTLFQFIVSLESSKAHKDPAMTVVPPYSQWRPLYSFYVPAMEEAGTEQYIIIVIKTSDASGLK